MHAGPMQLYMLKSHGMHIYNTLYMHAGPMQLYMLKSRGTLYNGL